LVTGEKRKISRAPRVVIAIAYANLDAHFIRRLQGDDGHGGGLRVAFVPRQHTFGIASRSATGGNQDGQRVARHLWCRNFDDDQRTGHASLTY
jgi:hypothetical protein